MEKSTLRNLTNLARSRSDPASTTEDIPRPRFSWKTRILIPAMILGGFLILLSATAYNHIIPAVQVNAAPVVLKRIQGTAAGTATVQAAGWIEAEPYKSYVTAQADGIVREVLVLEGDTLKAGQVVARLIDEDAKLAVQKAEAEVQQSEASLVAAHAEFLSAKTEWENPVERTRAIAISEAQLGESRATLEQIANEIAAEESEIQFFKIEYDRGVALHVSGAIAELELVRRRSRYYAQKSKIEAVRQRHAATKELIAKNEAELIAHKEFMRLRTEERRKLDRAQAAVTEAEAALKRTKTSLAEARLKLERMEIRSPIDGMVMSRLTEPGSKVVVISDNPGSARVLSVYDPRKLQVRVDVPLAETGKVGVGQQADIVVDVLPDRNFSGTVTRVLHEANIQKNTLEVKVAIENPEPQIRPEMLARVRFLGKLDPGSDTSKEADRLFGPENAFKSSGGSSVAWVISDFDGKYGFVAPRSVKLGHIRKDGWVDVLEGLQPGDLVITRSPSELKNGKKVLVMSE